MARKSCPLAEGVAMVRAVQSDEERAQAYAIRHQVFVDEQGVPPELELDSLDADAWHWLAWEQGQPVATARLISLTDRQGKVGRVAVLPAWRGSGVGRQLMFAIHDLAKEQGLQSLVLDAQLTVIPFYEGLGYETQGEVFEEAGILHRRMVRWQA